MRHNIALLKPEEICQIMKQEPNSFIFTMPLDDGGYVEVAQVASATKSKRVADACLCRSCRSCCS